MIAPMTDDDRRQRAQQTRRDQETLRDTLEESDDREIAMRWAKTPEAQMHMQSRVRASVESLTSELVKFRKSSDKASDRLVWLSALVVVLTAALVALTVVLAVRS